MISCEEEYTGEFDISGYCYDTCGGSPLVNYHIQYRNTGVFVETYTDTQGYFKLKGSYSITAKKPPNIEWITFRDTSNTSECCESFVLNDWASFENDTVYGYHTVNSVFRVKLAPGLSTTIEDTIFVRLSNFREYDGTYWPTTRSNTATYSIDYHKFYVGPFSNNQILDTVKTMVDPHVGTSEGSSGSIYVLRGPNVADNTGRGYYSFVNGQRNIGCDEYQMIEVSVK